MAMGPVWRIEMLGTLRASGAGRVITGFQTQQTASLFAYLASHPRRDVLREELIELLWPEVPLSAGRSRLSQAVWALRRQLEPPGMPAGSVLVASRTSLQLDPDSFQTDVAEFLALTHKASRTTEPSQQLALLEAAIELYRGPFLPANYDDWAYGERQTLADLYLSHVRQAATLYGQAGNHGLAITNLLRLVAQDPLQEELHLQLMRAYLDAGQPAQVRRQFEALETALQNELGESPSPEAVELVRQAGTRNGDPIAIPSPKVRTEDPIRPAPESARFPVPLTLFVGREGELGRLRAHVLEEGKRLVTLIGPGGCGKTRMALEAMRGLEPEFGANLWFVPLADLETVDQVAQSVLESLRVAPRAGREKVEQIVEVLEIRLAEGRGLLVLDNVEHLPEGISEFVRRLLDRVPRLSVLATSRRRLMLDGEVELPVGPLPLSEGARTDLAELMENPAIRLFVDRAQAVRAYFQITPRNAETIADLCRRLEGIPLAIELAAAQVHMLSPLQIKKHIEGRFDLLASRRKDIPARHRSLRAATDYSYLQLPERLQRLFASLAVFSGGWTLESAHAVCMPDASVVETLKRLTELHERSMIYVEETPQGMRYRMLETLRDYAFERLPASERQGLYVRHLAYFAEVVEVPVSTAPWQKEWLAAVEAERENIRTALSRGAEVDLAATLRLALSLEFSWEVKGMLVEGGDRLTALLRPEAPPGLAVRARLVLGRLTWLRGDFAAAIRSFEEAHGESLRLGLGHEARLADYYLATAKYRMGQPEGLAAALERNLAAAEGEGDAAVAMRCLMLLGNLALDARDMPLARDRYEQALQRAHALNDEHTALSLISNIGLSYFESGDYPRARRYWLRAFEMGDRLGERMRRTTNLINLGLVACRLGDFDAAEPYCAEALREATEIGSTFVLVECVEAFGEIAIGRGEPDRAARLYGAAAKIRARLGAPPVRDGSAREPEAYGKLRAALGEEGFEAEWWEGQSLDVPEITSTIFRSISERAA